MLNSRIVNGIRQTSFREMLVSAMLITCLLLSSCSVRKSIEAFFLGSVAIESGTGNGFKKLKAISENVQLTTSQLCSGSEKAMVESALSQNPHSPTSLLLQAVFFINLLGVMALALHALYHSDLSAVLFKVPYALSDAPIYIKNRLLLI